MPVRGVAHAAAPVEVGLDTVAVQFQDAETDVIHGGPGRHVGDGVDGRQTPIDGPLLARPEDHTAVVQLLHQVVEILRRPFGLRHHGRAGLRCLWLLGRRFGQARRRLVEQGAQFVLGQLANRLRRRLGRLILERRRLGLDLRAALDGLEVDRRPLAGLPIGILDHQVVVVMRVDRDLQHLEDSRLAQHRVGLDQVAFHDAVRQGQTFFPLALGGILLALHLGEHCRQFGLQVFDALLPLVEQFGLVRLPLVPIQAQHIVLGVVDQRLLQGGEILGEAFPLVALRIGRPPMGLRRHHVLAGPFRIDQVCG